MLKNLWKNWSWYKDHARINAIVFKSLRPPQHSFVCIGKAITSVSPVPLENIGKDITKRSGVDRATRAICHQMPVTINIFCSWWKKSNRQFNPVGPLVTLKCFTLQNQCANPSGFPSHETPFTITFFPCHFLLFRSRCILFFLYHFVVSYRFC